MNSDTQRWAAREALLDELLALDATARERRLADVAAQDADEAQVLRTWLRGIERSEGFLEAQPPATTIIPGALAGAWRLQRRIGSGGMGEVWLAERADGNFEKLAAVKFLHAGTPEMQRRMQHERAMLARLEHPGIARLLDGGYTADGTPFLVTEFVAGVPIDAWCVQHHASIDARLSAFHRVAEAVAYAHAHLVVHRDLKPANILVDARGEPRLLDFGIAKALDPAHATQTIDRMLTPQFAAPEQVSGGAITTATDVYALGALLYLLLSGRAPFADADTTLSALSARILGELPTPPSMAAAQPAPIAVRAALDAIVLKALATEPTARYASVDALLADLDAARDFRPIVARPPGRLYPLRRIVRRHRLALGVAATLLAVLLVGLSGTLWQAQRADQQRALAEAARESAEQESARTQAMLDFLIGMLGSAAPHGESVRVGDMLARIDDAVLHERTLQPGMRAALVDLLADLYAQRHDPVGTENLLKPLLEQEAAQLPDAVAAHAACVLAQAQRVQGRRDAAQHWVDAGIARAQAPALARQRAACLSQQAMLLEDANELDRALALHEQALALVERDNTRDNELVSALHSAYASTLYSADRLADARREHERALAILERAGRSQTAAAASEMAGIAVVARAQGLVVRADAEITRANALRQRVSGASAGLAQELINAAGYKIELAQPQAALALLDDAETMQREFVRPESMHYAMSAMTRGRALALLQRRDEAHAQFARARAMFAHLVAPTSGSLMSLDVSEAEMLLSDDASAADVAQGRALAETLEARVRAAGKDANLFLPKALLVSALAAARGGDNETAAAKARDARALYARDAAPDAYQMAECDVIVARAMAAAGEHAAAAALAADAAARLTRSLGAEHPRTRAAQALAAAAAAPATQG